MKTIILPGMGADATMYPKSAYKNLPGVIFADWPPYNGENSIADVAKSVITYYHINNQMVVGGSSLGGMVAIEIAKLIKIKKVILIGSTTDPKYVNPVLESLSPLTEKVPLELIQFIIGKMVVGYTNDLIAMIEKADTRFIRAMCKAIFDWEGIGDYQCTIYQIHGTADKVIFPPEKKVEMIPGGGHLISLTHSQIVSKFIENTIKVANNDYKRKCSSDHR